MKTNNEPNESPRWAVQFETHDGMFHPVWYGALDGPPISRERIMKAANAYLAENDWMKCVDDASPCDY